MKLLCGIFNTNLFILSFFFFRGGLGGGIHGLSHRSKDVTLPARCKSSQVKSVFVKLTQICLQN